MAHQRLQQHQLCCSGRSSVKHSSSSRSSNSNWISSGCSWSSSGKSLRSEQQELNSSAWTNSSSILSRSSSNMNSSSVGSSERRSSKPSTCRGCWPRGMTCWLSNTSNWPSCDCRQLKHNSSTSSSKASHGSNSSSGGCLVGPFSHRVTLSTIDIMYNTVLSMRCLPHAPCNGIVSLPVHMC